MTALFCLLLFVFLSYHTSPSPTPLHSTLSPSLHLLTTTESTTQSSRLLLASLITRPFQCIQHCRNNWSRRLVQPISHPHPLSLQKAAYDQIRSSKHILTHRRPQKMDLPVPSRSPAQTRPHFESVTCRSGRSPSSQSALCTKSRAAVVT